MQTISLEKTLETCRSDWAAGYPRRAFQGLDECIKTYPQAWAPVIQKARWQLDSGRIEAAARSLARARLLWAPERILAELEQLVVRGDGRAELHALERRVILNPDNVQLLTELARRALAMEEDRLFVRAMARACQVSGSAQPLQPLRATLASLAPKRLAPISARLVRLLPDHPDWAELHMLALAGQGQAGQAVAAFLQARTLDAWRQIPAPVIRALASISEPHARRFIQSVLKRLDEELPVELLLMAQALAGELKAGVAVKKLETALVGQELPATWRLRRYKISGGETGSDTDDFRARFRTMTRHADRGQWREAVSAAPDEDYTTLVRECARLPVRPEEAVAPVSLSDELVLHGTHRRAGIVLVFGGLNGAFRLPDSIMGRFLQALDLQVLHVKDRQNLLHLNGLRSVANDLDGTLTGLRELIGAHSPGRPVYTLGNSAAGFPALVYGARLGAVRSLSFSPFATVDLRVSNALKDFRGRAYFARVCERVNVADLEIGSVLSRAEPGFEAHVYAPQGPCEDQRHAAYLEPHEAVKLHWLNGFSEHGSLAHAAARLGMMRLLSSTFSHLHPGAANDESQRVLS